jgi:hypothetical protein
MPFYNTRLSLPHLHQPKGTCIEPDLARSRAQFTDQLHFLGRRVNLKLGDQLTPR